MTAYYFKSVPKYYLNKFVAVRTVFDNLNNILNIAEILNTSGDCKLEDYEDDFDFVIYSGEYCRAIVKKDEGYFSMAIPFQIVDDGDRVTFNDDFLREEVSGQLISIFRNAISTSQESDFSHESIILSLVDNFSLEISNATAYFDAFVTAINEDHGYFRFDDDLANEDGHFHPRYHIDVFFKNTSAIKIGLDEAVTNLDCFYALLDGKTHKRYLRKF